MESGVISVRYARALLKSAMALKLEEQVYKEMSVLAGNYIRVPELRLTIDNPMLSKSKKKELIKTACGGVLSELTIRFVDLVLKEGRERALQFMATSYITLYRKQKNIIRGTLTTAAPVSEETEKKMKAMVEKKTHGTVEFNTEVNPNIIGGFILEYDTYRMDASIQRKLRDIRNTLIK